MPAGIATPILGYSIAPGPWAKLVRLRRHRWIQPRQPQLCQPVEHAESDQHRENGLILSVGSGFAVVLLGKNLLEEPPQSVGHTTPIRRGHLPELPNNRRLLDRRQFINPDDRGEPQSSLLPLRDGHIETRPGNVAGDRGYEQVSIN
jgi:hypothetical protein